MEKEFSPSPQVTPEQTVVLSNSTGLQSPRDSDALEAVLPPIWGEEAARHVINDLREWEEHSLNIAASRINTEPLLKLE